MSTLTTHLGVSAIEFNDFGVFEITGDDAADYLHRQLSNEIRNLEPGHGTPVCYLNAQGRIRLYFNLWKTEIGYLALVIGSQRERFIEEMERLVFREKIQFVEHSDYSSFLFMGSPPSDLFHEIGFDSAPIPMGFSQIKKGEPPFLLFNLDWLMIPTFHILFPRGLSESINRIFEGRNVKRIDWETFHALRIEKGTPWPGFEINGSMIPYESGLEDAVSLTKGCYVGQEVVARMANLGTPPRLLRGLLFDEGQLPPPETGTPVKSGEVEIGEILSSAFSNKLQCAIATSSIRKKFAKAGTPVIVGETKATVSLFPL